MTNAVAVRKLRISDIYALNKMYDALSERTRQFFHPGFLGFSSANPKWLVTQLAISASSSKAIRKFLAHSYPQAAFLSIVSTIYRDGIVGFAYVKHRSGGYEGDCVGELGICVKDGYCGRHIGSALMDCLIRLAKDEAYDRISLNVEADNSKAIRLYEKYGFKKTRLIPNGDTWLQKQYDCFEMNLELNC